MSETVDTRIVEAKFDATDFEKGVNKTIKKLDELESKLKMKDSGKSVTEFAEDANKSLEKTNSALEKLGQRFTTFAGMIKQNILSGLAQQVSDVFFKIESGITNLTRSLTSGQVSAGMNKYTEILTAVRTMTASGVDESAAYEAVKRLGEYSDQTSYSLSQMTSGMSKLVAAGAKLGDAEKMMEGLANMSASAGVNIYDAQRAFLNFSQAYSSGSMRIQDWMSLESLNMATKEVMQVFMQAGEMTGRLTKDAKGVYKTSNKQNKKVKAGKQVATAGFRDTLSTGWLDQETMKTATAMLSYFEDLGISLNDLTSEQLEQFATKAFQAAKEARSFADVMGTLKDVISTGWANTFEKIFGTLSKATEFFTWLSESNIAEAIYSIGEFRNAVLDTWNFIGDSDLSGSGNGSDRFIQSIKNIDDAIGSLVNSFQKLMPTTTRTGMQLWLWTYRFQEFTQKVKDWFNETVEVINDDGKTIRKSRSDKIAETFKVISEALLVASDIISTAWDVLASVFEAFEPTFDAITSVLSNFADSVSDMRKNTTVFDDVRKSVKNLLIVAQPLLDVLPDILDIAGKIGAFMLSMAVDTFSMNIQLFADALGFIIELFGGKSAQQMEDGVGVLDRIKIDIKTIGEAASNAIDAVKEFFSNLLSDLRALLGLSEQTEGQEGGFFDNIKNFFETNQFVADVKAWVDKAIIDIGDFIKSVPGRIKQIGINIGDFIHGLLYKKEKTSVGTDKNGATIFKEVEVATPLKEWIDNQVKRIVSFVGSIPRRIKSIGNIISTFWHSLFYRKQKIAVDVDDNGNKIFKEVEVATPLKNWIDNQVKRVLSFVGSIPRRIKKAGNIISTFWSNLFYRNGTVADVDEKGNKIFKKIKIATPLKQWLDQALIDVVKFIKNMPKNIKNGINAAGGLIRTFVNGIFGKEDGSDVTGADIIAALKKPFENISVKDVIDEIVSIGDTLLNNIISIFTVTDDVETNSTAFANAVSNGIEWIKTKASNAWASVKDWFIHLPETIAGWFSGERTAEQIEEQTGEMGPIETAIKNFGNSVGHFVSTDLPESLRTFFDEAVSTIDGFWSNLYNTITGANKSDASGSAADAAKTAVNDTAPEAGTADVSKWKLFFDDIGEKLKNMVIGLPDFITQGIEMASAVIPLDEWMSKIGSWVNELWNGPETIVKDFDEKGKLISITKTRSGGLGDTLYDFITKTVPQKISDAWTWVSENATKWKDDVVNFLDDKGINWDTVKEKATNIGTTLAGYIKDIPTHIESAWNTVKNVLLGKEELVPTLIDTQGNIIKAETKRSGGLAGWFGDVFKDVGPSIINGFNDAIAWAGDKIDVLSGLLENRDKSKTLTQSLEEAAETSDVAKAVLNLGRTVKRLIVETIPNFMSQAFEEIKLNIPTLLGKLFNFGQTDIDNAKTEAQKTGAEMKEVYNAFTGEVTPDDKMDNLVTQADDFIANIGRSLQNMGKAGAEAAGAKDSVENIKEGTTGLIDILNIIRDVKWVAVGAGAGTIVGLLAIGFVLEKIGDLFTIADDIEDAATGIGRGIMFSGIGVALAGLGVLLGQIAILSNQTEITADGAKNDKLDYLMEHLTKIGEFIKDVLDKVLWIAAIWRGGEVVNSVAEIFSGDKGGLASLAGGIGLGAAGVGIGSILGNFVTGLITDIGPALNDLSTEIEHFADNITPALEKLSKVTTYIDAVSGLPGKLQEFVSGFYSIGFELFSDSVDTDMSYMIGIGEFINNLATGLSNYSNIKDPTTVLDNLVSMVDSDKFKELIEKMHQSIMGWATTTWGTNDIRDMSLEFDLLSSALSVFGTGITNLNPDSVMALDKTLDVFNKLAESFSLKGTDSTVIYEIASGKLGDLGRELEQFASAMKYFTGYVNEIALDVLDENEYSAFTKKTDLMAYVLETMLATLKSITYIGRISTYEEDLNTMATVLPRFGTAASTFINGLNTGIDASIDSDRMYVLTSAVDMLRSFSETVQHLDEFVLDDGTIDRVTDFINSLSLPDVNMTDMDVQTGEKFSNFYKFKTALKNLSSVIGETTSESLTFSPTLAPVISTESFADIETQLNEYFASKKFQIDIQPTIDAAILAGQFNFDFPDHDYSGQLTTINGSISGLGEQIGGLGDAISKMKIEVNVAGGGGTPSNPFYVSRRNTTIIP